jgi:malonyl CoA-acyl carrier protein transacylase
MDDMKTKLEKENRKEILRQLKEKEKADFNKSLPIDKGTFLELFEYLDQRLEEGCDHMMTLTLDFLNQKEIKNIDEVVEWLNEKGGYCDCEVLANVEERFE